MPGNNGAACEGRHIEFVTIRTPASYFGVHTLGVFSREAFVTIAGGGNAGKPCPLGVVDNQEH